MTNKETVSNGEEKPARTETSELESEESLVTRADVLELRSQTDKYKAGLMRQFSREITSGRGAPMPLVVALAETAAEVMMAGCGPKETAVFLKYLAGRIESDPTRPPLA